jgi:hypothetical protein
LTGINRSLEEAKNLLGENYCMTEDNVMKMLTIFMRSQCGVPVILLGECGCGKTMLIKYLCKWLGVTLLTLDVHGGTTEADILKIFKNANGLISKGKTKQVYVFLDEVNTCPHLGLISQAICQRTIYDEKINEGVQILAALNPYRLRVAKNQSSGLVFQLYNDKVGDQDIMNRLVYRVFPVPTSLRDFIFDFGSLSPDIEYLYIKSIASNTIGFIQQEDSTCFTLIITMISAAQKFIREIEKDASATSLRDISRVCQLISWFYQNLMPTYSAAAENSNNNLNVKKPKESEKSSRTVHPFVLSTILGISFVYFYRLDSIILRTKFWQTLIDPTQNSLKFAKEYGFMEMSTVEKIETIISAFHRRFCRKFQIEDGISLNQALMENLFVVTVCVLNRIPIFVVGKPGSSKTLTLQVIASNLQGKQSPVKFWRNYPAIYLVQYQCSPMSDSRSIKHQYEMAVRYQEHAQNTITVLLLDEVGLAEHSPDMPLKVLHGMLINPPIAIVGLSNWVLDAAKMNRAICLQRTEPSPHDIALTGKGIVEVRGDKFDISVWLPPLAKAYHRVYTRQKGRDFVGMRDFYNLLKSLRIFLKKTSGKLTYDILSFIVCRNFGGNSKLLQIVVNAFSKECFGDTKTPITPTISLVRSNIIDYTARHLMLLTKCGIALRILFNNRHLFMHNTKMLIGSQFREDKNELFLINQINEVKIAMAAGSTIILLNNDNIYEALYDVLNQRYLYKSLPGGKTKKMLRLAIGSRSQLCNVADTFKIIIIVEKMHAYRNLSFPLLNRFEKQIYQSEDLLTAKYKPFVEKITNWLQNIATELKYKSFSEILCGYYEETIASAVLTVTNYDSGNIDQHFEKNAKSLLSQIMYPICLISSSYVSTSDVKNMFLERTSLKAFITKAIEPSLPFGNMITLLTYSPLNDFFTAVADLKRSSLRVNISTLHLIEVPSESAYLQQTLQFLQKEQKKKTQNILVVLCDPIACSQELINQAKILLAQQRTTVAKIDENNIIIFSIFLPPGLKSRERQYALDFNHPWSYYFVDSLLDDESSHNTYKMYSLSITELYNQGLLSIKSTLNLFYQQAVTSIVVPNLDNQYSDLSARINLVENLISDAEFLTTVENFIYALFTKVESQGIELLQLQIIKANKFYGSLNATLTMALEFLISQSFTSILRYIDVNFNLVHFPSYKTLFLQLLKHPAIISIDSLFHSSKLGNLSKSTDPVSNTGADGPLVSRFPFSSFIIKTLNSQSTKDAVQSNTEVEDVIIKLDTVCETVFGSELVSLWNETFNHSHYNYFHDFVAIASPVYPNLTFEEKLSLYYATFSVFNKSFLQKISAIHAAYWESSEYLYYACNTFNYCNSLLKSQLIGYVVESPDKFSLLHNLLLGIITYFWKCLETHEPKELLNFMNDFGELKSKLYDVLELMTTLPTPPVIQDNNNNNSNNPPSRKHIIHEMKRQIASLTVIKMFLQEFFHQTYPKRVPEFLTNFVFNAKVYKPNSAIYLANMLDCIEASNHIRTAAIRNFVSRYLPEIVFGDIKALGNRKKIHEDLTLSILKIINGEAGHVLDKYSLNDCLSLRRICLKIYVQKQDRFAFPLALNNVEAAQLYMQYWMDHYTNSTSIMDDLLLDNAELDLLSKSNIESYFSQPSIFAYLQAIAKLTLYIQLSTTSHYRCITDDDIR